MLRGPLLVVAILVSSASSTSSSAEVTVVRAPISVTPTAAGRLVVQGDRVMEQRPGEFFGGAWTIGDGSGRGGAIIFWPWYVYEGEAAALALWARNNSASASPTDWAAAVTVWPLVLPGVAELGWMRRRREHVSGLRERVGFAARE